MWKWSASLLQAVLLVTVSQAQVKRPSVDDRADAKIVTYSEQFTITPKGQAKAFVLALKLPITLEGRQKLLDVRYSAPPQAELVKGENLYALFTATNLANQTRLTVEADVEIYRYDLETARKRNSRVPELTAEERQKYLASEPFLEKDDPSIQRASEQIPSGGSDIETIRSIQDFINRTMRYVRDPKAKGAVGALRDGYGKCVDFADLFVALCRAKKIPARTCEGFVAAPLK